MKIQSKLYVPDHGTFIRLYGNLEIFEQYVLFDPFKSFDKIEISRKPDLFSPKSPSCVFLGTIYYKYHVSDTQQLVYPDEKKTYTILPD